MSRSSETDEQRKKTQRVINMKTERQTERNCEIDQQREAEKNDTDEE